jgi:YHS domain-containing protein
MKHVISYLKSVVGAGVLLGVVALASAGAAEGANGKPKPYPLTTCIVSGEKIDGDMGAPYVFTYQGREIKLCCKDCKKKFDKEPATYLKKLDEGEKAKANPGSAPSQGHEGHSAHQH